MTTIFIAWLIQMTSVSLLAYIAFKVSNLQKEVDSLKRDLRAVREKVEGAPVLD